MAKLIASQGRIIFLHNTSSTFTSLREGEQEDPVLSKLRKQKQAIIKVPKSYLGEVSGEHFQPSEVNDQSLNSL